jgi:hypothetical protein
VIYLKIWLGKTFLEIKREYIRLINIGGCLVNMATKINIGFYPNKLNLFLQNI